MISHQTPAPSPLITQPPTPLLPQISRTAFCLNPAKTVSFPHNPTSPDLPGPVWITSPQLPAQPTQTRNVFESEPPGSAEPDSGEVLEVVGVGVDLNTMWGSFKVGSPLPEDFNNGEELLVIDIVVELHGDHQTDAKGNRAKVLSARVHLGEYANDGVVRGVAFEYYWQGGIKMVEDWGGGKGFSEEGEDALAPAIQLLGSVLPDESIEGFCDSGVVVNEHAIEISKPQKGLYLLDVLGWGLVEDGLDLGWVYLYSI
ncbi:hypothetical protein E4T56_gene10095 [Termitomyces sp. T112]|nr:hypothetical protein E4T56_gene10095 [Termitomyces sp. T112]